MHKKVRFLILGAGPSGLTFAHSLLDLGVSPKEIVVLEKESQVGGLCRSEIVDGAPLDIGGGHFLDVKIPEVLTFIFRFLPESEWEKFKRISKINIRNTFVDHPLEANLWQFNTDIQADYLESIAQAGCVRGEEQPATFAAWIKWKLGDLIADEYMLPYNRKIWSMDPDSLGVYWLHKLPSVSFRETLLSCLNKNPTGELPAHGEFLYPKKYGYGEVWRRMGEKLENSLFTDYSVEKIDAETLVVNDEWCAEKIISTVPWTHWKNFSKLPVSIQSDIEKLEYASINVDYFPQNFESNAHWIYEPDESVEHHRILLRSNFARNSRGYWTETNALRSTNSNGIRFKNEFAYPLNTIEKPKLIENVLNWGFKNNIIGLGRWGKWEHMNSDVAVLEALKLARDLAKD